MVVLVLQTAEGLWRPIAWAQLLLSRCHVDLLLQVMHVTVQLSSGAARLGLRALLCVCRGPPALLLAACSQA